MLIGIRSGGKTILLPQIILWVVVILAILALLMAFRKKASKYRAIAILGIISFILQIVEINSLTGVKIALMPFILLLLTLFGTLHAWSFWLKEKPGKT